MTESRLLHDIRLALGRQHDLALYRNQVGHCAVDGRHITYGLGKGSPDLVGILAPHGRWFCLEIKTERGRVSDEQAMWHDCARRRGAYVAVVRSVDEALAALEAARGEGRGWDR